MGYRYRLHVKTLPGKPDIVFASRRKVIFVHGCFWHQHHKTGCNISRLPKSNKHYWLSKLRKNVERDTKHQADLKKNGWKCLVIWECEIEHEAKLASRVRKFLG